MKQELNGAMSCCYPLMHDRDDEDKGTYASIDTNGINRELVQLSLARGLAICKDGGEGGLRELYCVHVLDNEIEKISSFIDNLHTVDPNVQSDKVYKRALANRCLLVQIKNLLLSGDQSKCLLNICSRLVHNDEYWGYTSACEWPAEGL